MAFFDSADDRFIRSAANAWASSRLSTLLRITIRAAARGHCVLWSVSLDVGVDRPCNQFDGGSLGGAFAVALHEIACERPSLGCTTYSDGLILDFNPVGSTPDRPSPPR